MKLFPIRHGSQSARGSDTKAQPQYGRPISPQLEALWSDEDEDVQVELPEYERSISPQLDAPWSDESEEEQQVESIGTIEESESDNIEPTSQHRTSKLMALLGSLKSFVSYCKKKLIGIATEEGVGADAAAAVSLSHHVDTKPGDWPYEEESDLKYKSIGEGVSVTIKGYGRHEDDVFRELIKALRQDRRITSLNLAGNNIGEEGAYELVSILERGPFYHLTSLNLAGNNIGERGADGLASILERGPFYHLTSLNLAGNNIGARGAWAIARAMERGSFYRLTSLNLADNNIGAIGAWGIARAMFALMDMGFFHLTSLNLAGNNIPRHLAQELKYLVIRNRQRIKFERKQADEKEGAATAASQPQGTGSGETTPQDLDPGVRCSNEGAGSGETPQDLDPGVRCNNEGAGSGKTTPQKLDPGVRCSNEIVSLVGTQLEDEGSAAPAYAYVPGYRRFGEKASEEEEERTSFRYARIVGRTYKQEQAAFALPGYKPMPTPDDLVYLQLSGTSSEESEAIQSSTQGSSSPKPKV